MERRSAEREEPMPTDAQSAAAPAKPVRDAIGAEALQDGRTTDTTEAIVAAAKAMRDGASPEAPAVVEAKVCLIVDDSRVIRKVSSKIARSLGYVPVEAQDGEEALARCKKAMPALVLTDWNMPEMDGIEFVKRLRAIPTPKAPMVMFCTSNGEAKDIHEGIGAGADDYIVKPFDEAALRAKLEKLGRD
ncbi:MAG: response regulator [Pseudomonadota bacterium]